jgi:hypothetical protein
MLRRLILNTSLVAISLTVAALGIEAFMMLAGLPRLPLRLHHHFGAPGILAQPTKAGVVPRDYALLLGDSFAHGAGDWMLTADHGANARFHSLHVLRDLTGWDLISMGHSGSGSLDGYVGNPRHDFAVINASPFLRLGPPRRILVYFYEGNDIINNTTDGFDSLDAAIAEADRRIAYATKGIKPFFFSISAALRILRHNVRIAFGKGRPDLVQYPPQPSWATRKRGENALLVGGRTVHAPALQGPSPRLSAANLQKGVAVFATALRHLKARFPGSEIAVVYIPAVIVSYAHAGDAVAVELQRPGNPRSQESIRFMEQRSDGICGALKQETLAAGARFIDTRPGIRAAAKTRILHGPRDAAHFNRAGYEALAAAIVDGLKNSVGSGPCTAISGGGRSPARDRGPAQPVL